MSESRQPMLIVQGELDTQVPPHHADQLAAAGARAQRRQGGGRGREGAGRESPAGAGEDRRRDEYGSLGPDAKVSPQVTGAIVSFLTKALQE